MGTISLRQTPSQGGTAPEAPKSLTETLVAMAATSIHLADRLDSVLQKLKPSPGKPCGVIGEATPPSLSRLAEVSACKILLCFKLIEEIEEVLF